MAELKKHISSQYIGRENKPVVKVGDRVFKGSMIATDNSGSSRIYSTLEGRVKKISTSAILIETEIEVKEKPKTQKVIAEQIKKNEGKKNTKEEVKKIEKIDEKSVQAEEKKSKTKLKQRNVLALDGLRSLAIVSVMLYHLGFGWYKGGLIGVTIFFVLSGYLITGILINEIQATGKINLKSFWIHRIRRLFPAIIVVVFIVALLCVLFNHLLLTKMKPDIIPSLCWMQNWWYILRDMSYFESLGEPSPLVHFWSLAIEEQFYLIWPLILILAYKLGAKNKIIRRICILLAILSALEMVLIYNPNVDPTRAYYGTDTRAFSLLIGAWLAYVWPWQNLKKGISPLNKLSTKHFDIIGLISLVLLILIMIFIDGMSPAMYYGVLFLASLLSAAIISTLVLPDSKLAKIFAYKPFVWIGKRSYGMYLWHFPIILLLKPVFGAQGNEFWFAILVFATVIAISALQYKYIENPIRRGFFKKWYKNWQLRNFKFNFKEILCIALCSVFIVGTSLAVIVTPDETYAPEKEIQSTGEDVEHATVTQTQYYPLLVGDSVPAALQLTATFPLSLNDSVVSRWTWQAVNVLQEYANQGALSNVVIVACFSNHLMGDNDLNRLKEIVGDDRDLFLINACCPYDYCAANNEAIAKFCQEHDKVHLIDWYGAAMQNPDLYFYEDKTHLNGEGRTLYTKLIADAINPLLPENARCDVTKIHDLYMYN